MNSNTLIVSHVYYWNCRLGGKTALLAGPFISAELAQKCADYVGPVVVQENPEAKKATFGVMKCKAPGPGLGDYNKYLPGSLQGELLLDTGRREPN